MKVLILSQHFWPESFRINDVALALKNMGHDIFVLTGQPNYPEGKIFSGYSAMDLRAELYNGMDIFRVPLFPRGRGSGWRLILNYFSFILSGCIFGPFLLRGHQIDCILVYGTSPIFQAFPAIFIGKIKRARTITWVQDLWPESLNATGFLKNRSLINIVEKIVAWIYRHSDVLLAQSLGFIQPIKKLAGNTPVFFHPQPGDLVYSDPKKSIKPSLILKGKFNIVFTGNLGKVQSLATILKAAHILRDNESIRFVLVGSGSCFEWLGNEVKKLQLRNVDLPGRFPVEEIPYILSQSSVLLVSLIRDPVLNLTIPGKIQTYLAAQKPILASMDGEGARVIVESGAGYTSPAEDPEALADNIRKIYSMPACDLKRMGDNGRAYYDKEFDPMLLSDKLAKIMLDTLHNKM